MQLFYFWYYKIFFILIPKIKNLGGISMSKLNAYQRFLECKKNWPASKTVKKVDEQVYAQNSSKKKSQNTDETTGDTPAN